MYGTVPQFYSLLAPPDALWPTGRLKSGAIPVPTRSSGTGTGSIDVRGNAHGSYSLAIKCTSAGQVNSSTGANPGALPKFAISIDGGTTYSRPYRVSADDNTAFLRDEQTGLQLGLIFDFSGAFDLNDIWTTTAEPSPDVVLHLDAAQSAIDGALSDSLRLPLTTVPLIVVYVQGALALWSMIRACGLDSRQDFAAYSPTEPRMEIGNISPAAKLNQWRAGEDLKIFTDGDEAALRFTNFGSTTPAMAPYLPI